MEPIRFENLYDFLTVELGRPADKVRASVAGDADEIAEAANQVFLARSFPFVLTEPLNTQDGTMALLAVGADLGKKISSVISRQAKDPEYPLGPIVLASADPLVAHYRKMVMDHITPAVDEMKTHPPPVLGRLLGGMKPGQRVVMDSVVEKGVAMAMNTSQSLMTMLQIARGEEFEARWKLGLCSAYTAMAIMGALSELATDDEVKGSVEKVGNAAIFQDLSVMAKPSLYSKETARHPQRSAQMAEGLGLSREVCELILCHHTFLGENSREEEGKTNGAGKELSMEARVLVVANLFISAVTDHPRSGADIEAIKGLNFMMGEGKVEKRAVVTLTRLYLSHKFALFFEKAMEISKLCPFENEADPILWNILGERNPQKFICSHRECAHLGSQTTLVSQTIPVKFDGQVVSKIRKGEYNSCRYLTTELGKLYKEIALLNTK